MNNLESYVCWINDFEITAQSNQIDIFAYYILCKKNQDWFSPKDIEECFHTLDLKPYSNISAYLNKNLNGKNKKYLKKTGNKFYLERNFKSKLDEILWEPSLPKNVRSDFFDIDLFNDTKRNYLITTAKQALLSYNIGIYDGCGVLTRKLLEILIIECFERHGVENLIKKSDWNFFYLSDLIVEFLKEPKWSIWRNAKNGLPKIKKIWDLSAHNRRYIARKNDLDDIKHDLRVVLEELIHLIDYENWHK